MTVDAGFATNVLTSRQKAAIIVRYLLAEGSELDLRQLSTSVQAALAQEMAIMGLIDRETRDAVVTEFCDMLEAVGLSFPGTIDGALALLDGHLSDTTTSRLRRMAVLSGISDPWERIAALPAETLAELVRVEAVEITAVMFSNMPIPRAAEVFKLIDPELARQIAYSMSLTGTIEAPALRRIGLALVQAADALPQPALPGGPVEKVGAILNYAQSDTRDSVLAGLDSDDAEFAENVRKAIFTWVHVPERIDPRDIPRVVREMDGALMIKAMAGARDQNLPTVEFILGSLSTRLADSMREEMESAGKISAKDAEAAMSEFVSTIRRMESEGQLIMIAPDADEE